MRKKIFVIFLVLAFFQSGAIYAFGQTIQSSDWQSYQYDATRGGYNSSETLITSQNANSISQKWSISEGSSISTEPAVVNNIAYWGSWDGYEHATDINGNQIWKTFLGQTTSAECNPPTVGVASSATIREVSIKGINTLVDFVAGGNAKLYALNANNGSIIWSTQIGQSPNTFLWSSPAYFNGSIYIGKSSFGDCPLVQGQVLQIKASNGAVQHIFHLVPNGCTGASVWGSVAIDRGEQKVYFATGNPGFCSTNEIYAESVVELNLADLTLVGSWQVPSNQLGVDSDFGNTPSLFYGNRNGLQTPMVGVANKNGIFYTFIRDQLNNGPVWQDQVAIGGDCPDCGNGSISPAAWDQKILYVAGGNTVINGTPCKGSVRAINTSNGSYIWEHCFLNGHVVAGVTETPGVLYIEDAHYIDILNSQNGTTLNELSPAGSGSVFDSGAAISNGRIYIGNLNGTFASFGP